MNTEIALWDPKGKGWAVKTSVSKTGRIMMKEGWKAFYYGNNLKKGDQCVFEFLCNEDKICKEMNVQIVPRVPMQRPRKNRGVQLVLEVPENRGRKNERVD